MFIKSPILNKVPHGFGTRLLPIKNQSYKKGKVEEQELLANLNSVQNIIGCKISLANQTHSGIVRVISQGDFNNFEDGDAQIVTTPDIAICVQHADCLPILCYDVKNKIAASIHCGWRGIPANIIEHTLANLFELGCKSEDILCAFGPHISKYNLEIGEDVLEQYNAKNKDYMQFFHKCDNALFLDMQSAASLIFHQAGIFNIDYSAAIDTFSNEALFFSYRRHTKINDIYGSMLSYIKLTSS